MKGVVLAAGLGTRMRPLTFTKPKFLLPVAGKPALDHVFDTMKNAGISEVGVVVGFGKEQIVERYGDGSGIGMKVEYLHQKQLLGTANAVSLAEEFVGNDDFMVMNGDTLVDLESTKSVLEVYRKRRSERGFGGVMGTIEVDEPEQFGIVEMKGETVRRVIEKPKRTGSRLANAGLYIFTSEIFGAIRRTKKSRRGEYELTTSIQIMIDDGLSIYTAPLSLWADIGRPWDLLVANEHFLKNLRGEIHGKVEVGANVGDRVYVGENSVIRSGSYILGPAYIGRNCDIGPNCFIRPSTCIGDHVRIGNAVEIKNSIIMDHTNVGHLSYVGDSVIGMNCNLGAGTTIANLRLDGKPVKMEVGGKVVSSGRRKLGTIIADNVRTGINCTINVGVKIGPDSAIGPGAVVYRDVPPNTMVYVEPSVRLKRWKP
ncbi:MAG: sugar phosphate nucleotidyltransferase [Candidatus Hadarchaeales archaeon]